MGILFFNWYGYQWLSAYLQNRADLRLEASFDKNNFDESRLISVKIPITTLSYYNSSNRFERVDGQIEIGGAQYKYVKRRLFKDSLELLCIPNQAAMTLQVAKNEFFRQVNDLQQNTAPGKKAPVDSHKNITKDYCSSTSNELAAGLSKAPATPTCRQPVDRLPSSEPSPTEYPPDQRSVLS
jgi:hypothetical protein